MKQAIPWLISLILVVFLVFFDETPAKPVIPVIVTKYDTAYVTPTWLADSEKAWKSRKATRETVEVVISNTILLHDTTYVGPDTTKRDRVWPVLEYHGGVRFGDTATVVTFSLRSGVRSASRLFSPGILTDISADTGGIPRITYAPFPEPKKPSLIYRLKLVLAGVLIGRAF